MKVPAERMPGRFRVARPVTAQEVVSDVCSNALCRSCMSCE